MAKAAKVVKKGPTKQKAEAAHWTLSRWSEEIHDVVVLLQILAHPAGRVAARSLRAIAGEIYTEAARVEAASPAPTAF
jgi:hypothetical protein